MKEQNLSVPRKIILTSMRLFSSDGFQSGIDRIIAEAGIAKMSLYRHFPSKELLMIEAVSVSHTEMMYRLRDIIEEHTHDLKKLRLVFEELCSLLSSDDCLTRLVPKACIDFRVDSPVHEAAVKMKYELMQTLEALCTAAGFTSPKTTCRKLMMIADGCFAISSAIGAEDAVRYAKQMGETVFSNP